MFDRLKNSVDISDGKVDSKRFELICQARLNQFVLPNWSYNFRFGTVHG